MNYIEAIGSLVVLETSYLVYKTFQKTGITQKSRTKIVCDTSALIDGRIVSIARSGFLSSELIIPRSVVRELQFMADRADHDKRERARYGLDVIKELQEIDHVTVTNYDDGEVHRDGVDEQLIVLAHKLGARLCTTDYNLNKVARTENVTVVNVNEMAHALRPMHLPGEMITIGIVAPGQNKDQGVGYLDDGTMVVVDHAKQSIGSTVRAETIRVLQTEAGRMVFAKLVVAPGAAPAPPSPITASAQPNTGKQRPARRNGPRQRPQQRNTPEDALIQLANGTK